MVIYLHIIFNTSPPGLQGDPERRHCDVEETQGWRWQPDHWLCRREKGQKTRLKFKFYLIFGQDVEKDYWTACGKVSGKMANVMKVRLGRGKIVENKLLEKLDLKKKRKVVFKMKKSLKDNC